MPRLLRSPRFGVAVAVALALALLPLWMSAYVLGVLTIAYYFGVFAMSWDLLFGYAGEVNFGPTFLIGLGAYAGGMLNTYTATPMWLCIVAGAFAAAGEPLDGMHVALVDDVVTTGATLAAAALALETLGPGRVGAITFARAPVPA